MVIVVVVSFWRYIYIYIDYVRFLLSINKNNKLICLPQTLTIYKSQRIPSIRWCGKFNIPKSGGGDSGEL